MLPFFPKQSETFFRWTLAFGLISGAVMMVRPILFFLGQPLEASPQLGKLFFLSPVMIGWSFRVDGALTGLFVILLSAGVSSRKPLAVSASLWGYRILVALGGIAIAVSLHTIFRRLPPDLEGPEIFAEDLGRGIAMFQMIKAIVFVGWAAVGWFLSARCCRVVSRFDLKPRGIKSRGIKSRGLSANGSHWPLPTLIAVVGIVVFLASSKLQNRLFLRAVEEHKYGTAQDAHRRSVQCLAFSPDGRWLASGGDDGEFRLWDMATNTQHRLENFQCVLSDIRWSNDSKFLMIASTSSESKPETSAGQLRLLQVDSDAIVVHEVSQPVTAIALSPDNQFVAMALKDRSRPSSIELRELPSLMTIGQVSCRGLIHQMEFRRHSNELVVCGDDFFFFRLPLNPIATPVFEIALNTSSAAFVMSSDEQEIVLVSALAEAHRMSMDQRDGQRVVIQDYNVINDRNSGNQPQVALTPNDRTLLLSSETRKIRSIDLATRRVLMQWSEAKVVTAMDLSPDGQILAVGGMHFIRLYQVETGKLVARLAKG